MTTIATPAHPLSSRHFRQIARRDAELRDHMYSVWGVTWRPGGRRSSFLSNLYRPLGAATMMVQASYPLCRSREGIALFGVGARIDPTTAIVSYDEIRLYHDFHRHPFVGARGRALDPRDERQSRGGQGSWVQLALEVDALRERAVLRNRPLPVVPKLPNIYLGYGTLEKIRFEVTPALRGRAIRSMQVEWSGKSLGDLSQFQAESYIEQEKLFDRLTEIEQSQVLRTAWEEAIIPPSDPVNTTGLWLLPHELGTDVFGSNRVYEYFGDLVGAHIFNPARLLVEKTIPNPAIALAAEHGIDLVADLKVLEDTVEGAPQYREVEERIVGLVPLLRDRIKASAELSDQDMLSAICAYELPVTVIPPVAALAEAKQVARMREHIKPHLNECCADDDVLLAVRNPHQPLYAAGLCGVQSLFRDSTAPIVESLTLSAELLERDRVEARLAGEQVVAQAPALRDARADALAA